MGLEDGQSRRCDSLGGRVGLIANRFAPVRRGLDDEGSGGGAKEGGGEISAVVSNEGDRAEKKSQFVSVMSSAGSELLSGALHRQRCVTILKVGGRSVVGFVCVRANSDTGYSLMVRRSDGVASGRVVPISLADQIALTENLSSGGVVAEVRGEVGGVVRPASRDAMLAGGSAVPVGDDADRAGGRVASEARAHAINFDIGHFLHLVENVDGRKMAGRIQNIQVVRVSDVLAILDSVKVDRPLAEFLRLFLTFGRKSECDLQSIVDKFSMTKGFQKDPSTGRYPVEAALSYANAFLRLCIPSCETKAREVTFMDHGSVVQIAVIDGERRAFLPDFREGDSSCRDELFALHSRAKDVVGQLRGEVGKSLLEALLFQYYGVPFKDLSVLGIKGAVRAIEILNEKLKQFGFVVYANNEVAVLGEVGKPAVLLADCTDAKAYAGRFSGQAVGGLEEAKAVYGRSLQAKYTRCSRRSGESYNASAGRAVRGFISRTKVFPRSRADVDGLVAAFVADDASAVGRAEVAGVCEGVREGVCEGGVAVSADWIDVVSSITPELKQLHNEASEVARVRVQRLDIRQYNPYLNGQLLVLALLRQYNGVKISELEGLPFAFRASDDTCLVDVIAKTNSAIKRYGWKIYARGGVVLFGPDLEGEAHRGEKVQIYGRGFTREDYNAIGGMPIKAMLDRYRKKRRHIETAVIP